MSNSYRCGYGFALYEVYKFLNINNLVAIAQDSIIEMKSSIKSSKFLLNHAEKIALIKTTLLTNYEVNSWLNE